MLKVDLLSDEIIDGDVGCQHVWHEVYNEIEGVSSFSGLRCGTCDALLVLDSLCDIINSLQKMPLYIQRNDLFEMVRGESN